jgi:hypothetical protein
MGLPVRENSPETSPPTMPTATEGKSAKGVPQINVSNGDVDENGAPFSANDNIRRFAPPSRALSPSQEALFHSKTRCFV